MDNPAHMPREVSRDGATVVTSLQVSMQERSRHGKGIETALDECQERWRYPSESERDL